MILASASVVESVCVSCTRLFTSILQLYTLPIAHDMTDYLVPWTLPHTHALTLSPVPTLVSRSNNVCMCECVCVNRQLTYWYPPTHTHTLRSHSDWNFIIIVNADVTHTTTRCWQHLTWLTTLPCADIENWLNWTLMTLNRTGARVKTSKATAVYDCCCWK